jgi:hypothetical protein
VRWAASAAASASSAWAKAAQKASPIVLKTWPPWLSMAVRSSASWRTSAEDIASRWCSHRRVEPSMSVKRKVSVPVGNVVMAMLIAIGGGARMPADEP